MVHKISLHHAAQLLSFQHFDDEEDEDEDDDADDDESDTNDDDELDTDMMDDRDSPDDVCIIQANFKVKCCTLDE